MTFDSPSLDSALPEGGLRRGAVHEILGPGRDRRGDGAAAAFAAVLLGRLMQTDPARRPAVWCSNRRVALRQADLAGRPYPLGLAGFGVAVDRLLFVESASDGEALWATEETARSAAAAVLVVELGRLPAVAARRLQLAAEASNTAVLALRSASDGVGNGFVHSRWQLQTVPATASVSAGECRWRLDLLRCRGSWGIRGGGGRASWLLRWRNGRLRSEPWQDERPETPAERHPPALRMAR
ncbi:MAG: hypothetical protein KDC18_05595 [Alphaproteobacteria bacterium]|nr:hypothetical protein [Alphaproteobacteria bacterium]MCB9927957.1 hypothetical protein [Alphaproteobacteria bacterium]